MKIDYFLILTYISFILILIEIFILQRRKTTNFPYKLMIFSISIFLISATIYRVFDNKFKDNYEKNLRFIEYNINEVIKSDNNSDKSISNLADDINKTLTSTDIKPFIISSVNVHIEKIQGKSYEIVVDYKYNYGIFYINKQILLTKHLNIVN